MFRRAAPILIPAALLVAALSTTPRPASGDDDPPFPLEGEDAWASFEEMHAWHTKVFVESPGFGQSRMPRLASRPRPNLATGDEVLAIERVDLIGLVKREHPVLYAPPAAFAPEREMLAWCESRDLETAESAALERLRAGEDVVNVSDADGSGRLVLGALRAGKSCVGCHAGKREGDLLGALVYRLRARE